jgi:hypothetical protein
MRITSSCTEIVCPLTFDRDNDGLDGVVSYGVLLPIAPHSIASYMDSLCRTNRIPVYPGLLNVGSEVCGL